MSTLKPYSIEQVIANLELIIDQVDDDPGWVKLVCRDIIRRGIEQGKDKVTPARRRICRNKSYLKGSAMIYRVIALKKGAWEVASETYQTEEAAYTAAKEISATQKVRTQVAEFDRQ